MSEQQDLDGFIESSIEPRHLGQAGTINYDGEDPGYCGSNILFPDVDSHINLTSNSDYCVLKDDVEITFELKEGSNDRPYRTTSQ